MESYDLKEIMSRDDENSLWVSLGFSSEMEELDVLFIVCGKSIDEQDENNEMDGIYLERYDQENSGYKLADSIKVSNSKIQVDLNPKGQKELNFKDIVTFQVPVKLDGFSNAINIFEKMTLYKSGEIVRVAEQF